MDGACILPTTISPSLGFLRTHSPSTIPSSLPRSQRSPFSSLVMPAAAELFSARDSLFLSETDFPIQEDGLVGAGADSRSRAYCFSGQEKADKIEMTEPLTDTTLHQPLDGSVSAANPEEITPERVALSLGEVKETSVKAISLPLHIDYQHRGNSGDDSFSSSPSKIVYAITEPGEMSTGSSGRLFSDKSVKAGGKGKGSKARKRAQVRTQKEAAAANFEPKQRHLPPLRKPRSKKQETPESIPQLSASRSKDSPDWSSEEEQPEKAVTSENSDIKADDWADEVDKDHS